MKKYSLLIVLSCLTVLSFAQDKQIEFVGEKFLIRTKSYPQNDCRTDLNGDYCAVVEVELHLDNVTFTSDYMVGNAEYHENAGIYRLFVVPSKVTSSKKIEVAHKDYLSLSIPINRDVRGEKLVPKEVYRIKLNAPETDPNKNKEILVINTNVDGCQLTIREENGITEVKHIKGTEYSDKLTRNGRYYITVSKDGYITEKRDVRMTGTQNLNIQLKSVKGTLTITKEIDAEVYINDKYMGTDNAYSLEPGQYSIYTKLAGYKSETLTIHLTRSGKNVTIKLSGNLTITEPKNAQINIRCVASDCLEPSTYRYQTGTLIPNLLGKYTITVQKDDYEDKVESIDILPQNSVSKSIHLSPLKHRYAYFGFLGSMNLTEPTNVNSPIGISFGVMRKAGWYMNFKTSLHFWGKSIYQIENKIDASKAENSKLRSKVGTSSYDVTTGLLVNLTPKQSLYWYVGGGYGGYEFNSDVFSYNISHGGNVETGLLCRIGRKKHCSFLMSVGYNLFINNSHQLHNIQCLIGIAFDRGVRK